MSTAFEYWASGAGLSNITPQDKLWPEGEWFRDWLPKFIGVHRSVLEFGCGPGRLASLFSSSKYVGVDICEPALRIARLRNPHYTFKLLQEDYEKLPLADVTLAHTVMLHIPDDKLRPTVTRFNSKLVLISEVLGKRWRRTGNPPVFNREVADYQAVMALEYDLVETLEFDYEHYRNTKLSVMVFKRDSNKDG